MLTALGVPWVARKAIAKASRTIHIEHDHDSWDETTVTSFKTMQDHYDLTGAPMVKISPVDKSSFTSTTVVDGENIITTTDFGPNSNKSQYISRSLENDGRQYVVKNTLTVGDKKIFVRSVFNRMDPT